MGLFYTHLFILLTVFVLHTSHLTDLIVRKPGRDRYAGEYPPDDGYETEEYDAVGEEWDDEV